MNRPFKFVCATAFVLTLTACTTISNWFADEEELAIRELPELQLVFEPSKEWRETVGDGVDDFYSRLSPVVAYGKLFAADRTGTIVALEPTTGDRIWRTRVSKKNPKRTLWNLYGLFAGQISAKVSGGLSAAYQTVFLGTEDGVVYALDESTGDIKWQTTIGGEIVAAPAIDSGIVVVNTVSGTLFGLDSESGEIKWQNDSDVPPLTIRGVSAPAAAAGGAIVGLANGRLRVSIIDSGMTAWEQVIAKPTGATELERIVDIDSKPLVFGPTLFVVSYAGSLASVDLRNGNVIWTREYASFRDLSIQGNRIFVTDNNGNLYAIDRRNGVELWSNGQLRQRNLTAPTVTDEFVVVGDKFGYVHYFTQDEGKYVSRIEIGDDDEDEGVFVAPVYDPSSQLLFVKTRDGRLTAVSNAE